MYAVIETGGKQMRVQVGDLVRVETLDGDVGSKVVFDRVLMVGEGEKAQVGSPAVEGAKVQGSIVEQGRAKKIRIFTYKPRQNSNRRRMGHRQNYTAVKIESIDG
ncbi:MAG: 50S ribosomal protein L21 [Acidobacteria bacterium]|nr:50S ribosomal protein L21 [Acidobacteriota bacterium]NIM61284.1 50S ribosomal protein L21 [Acidobacteriota bacterium]NIQ31593.1 50S ribosomal protein L21 [Acidobacteriota bacterium]NIQ86846.1 50S ribosomal protein L21 [Acidobacteriota bacterium]NIT12178.1 50S ribosomal protein L21 [Acidobacteriota bacterium]